MAIHRIFGLFCSTLLITFILGAPVIDASSQNWNELFSFIDSRYPPVYEPVGKITEINRDRIVFKNINGKKSVARGTELLVTSRKKGIPLYLQEVSSIIKVSSFFGDNVLATRILDFDNKPKKGDTVVKPSSPVVYLYTNIRDKDAFPPYSRLLEQIIAKNLEVIELAGSTVTDYPSRYSVLMRFEAGEGYLVCKLQSLYSRETFYSRTVEHKKKLSLLQPSGSEVQPAKLEKRRPLLHEVPVTGSPVPKNTLGEKPAQLKRNEVPDVAGQAPPNPFKAKASKEFENEYFILEGEYKRFVMSDLNGDGKQEVVLMNDRGVFALTVNNGNLLALDKHLFPDKETIALHLHSADMDGDGNDEFFVTLAEETQFMGKTDFRLMSLILTYKEGTFSPLADGLAYYLRVIQDRTGQNVIIGQEKGSYDQYEGPIFEIKYDPTGGTVRKGPPYEPAEGIYSVYQFNLDPENNDHALILEPTDNLYGYYTPHEKVDADTPRNYGPYREIAYPQKLEKDLYIRGGFDKLDFKDIYAPRRFILHQEYDGQCFLINKERKTGIGGGNTLKRILGKPEGMDSLVGISWRGKKLVETWESEKIAKDILDFCFKDNKVYVLTRNAKGDYALEALH